MLPLNALYLYGMQVNDDIIRVNDNAVLGLSSEEVAKLFAAYDPVILEVSFKAQIIYMFYCGYYFFSVY